MAGGLRDLLALQGVVPVSAPPAAANPGLRLGNITGTWITGAPGEEAANGGLRLGQIDGSWITGAPEADVPPPEPGPPGRPKPPTGGSNATYVTSDEVRKAAYELKLELSHQEMEEIIIIVRAALEILL